MKKAVSILLVMVLVLVLVACGGQPERAPAPPAPVPETAQPTPEQELEIPERNVRPDGTNQTVPDFYPVPHNFAIRITDNREAVFYLDGLSEESTTSGPGGSVRYVVPDIVYIAGHRTESVRYIFFDSGYIAEVSITIPGLESSLNNPHAVLEEVRELLLLLYGEPYHTHENSGSWYVSQDGREFFISVNVVSAVGWVTIGITDVDFL